MVNTEDEVLTRRIRDIVAVVTEDIDAVRVEVEDGIAYVEGVVSSTSEARAIAKTVRKSPGLSHVVMCLSTERVLDMPREETVQATPAAHVLMHYHSLS